jgi:predicted RNA-binding Zn-ribbon protein involved in translation (DUF1610 family)
MSNFKIRKNKIGKSDVKDTSTLDKKHKELSKKLQNDLNSLPEKEKKIKELKEEIETINKNTSIFSANDLEKKANILDNIRDLENEIEIIKNKTLNYYDKTGDILSDYYKIRDDTKKYSESRNIKDLFRKKKNIENTQENSKAKLFDQYCQRVEGVRTIKDDGTKRVKYCIECGIEKILDYGTSCFTCPECGDIEEVILDEDRQIKEYSPYRRINHFKEWLNQFQAKESTEIDEEIFKKIISELNKYNDNNKINRERIKEILKKMGRSDLYEHITFIINKITNKPAPYINRKMEKKFINMFSQIEEIWESHKPPGRKNFLSYSYVLHKFCLLLELDHLLSCFPLLKSSKNLKEQEEVWEKMCKTLKWEFIPSI